MSGSRDPVLRVAAVRDAVLADARALRVSLPEVGRRTVWVAGSPGAGASTIARAVLDMTDQDLPEWLRSPEVPVEYVHGGERAMLAGFGEAGAEHLTWSNGRRRPSSGVRRARVVTPAPLLAAASLRLIDLPGGRFPDPAPDPRSCVLFVVAGRGLTEDDVRAMERLKPARIAVVQNIWDSELLPTRSEVAVTDLQQAMPGFAAPLVPLTVKPDGGHAVAQDARAVLTRLIASLIDDPDRSEVAALASAASRARAELRRGHRDRLTAIRARAAAPSLAERLEALRDLTGMVAGRSRVAEMEQRFTRLLDLPDEHRRWQERRPALLRGSVETACRSYRLRAATRRPGPAAAESVRIPALGGHYAAARRNLTGILDNILHGGDVLRLTGREQRQITDLAGQIAQDRIEIAVLGQFSAGKSSLINAILGVPVNDNARELLPTSATPETATVTRVSYADEPVARPSWLPKVSLTFLRPVPGHGHGHRIGRQELAAFHAWLDSGDLDPKSCVFQSLTGEKADDEALLAAFHRLRRELPGTARFAYHRGEAEPALPDGPLPAAVEIREFRTELPSSWPEEETRIDAVFEAVREPRHALRVDRLDVGHPHELLRHAAFLDTPGTDAPIPHHKKVAHGIVRDRGMPVIYCFAGDGAGAREDRENLSFLRSRGVGATDLSRFFMVITRKGRIRAEDRPTVKRTVRNELTRLGLPGNKRIYFTEVVSERNKDFEDLVTDLGEFVDESRSALIEAWAEQCVVLMAAVRERAQSGLDTLKRGKEERRRQADALTERRSRLDEITEEFENVLVRRARKDLEKILGRQDRDIEREIEGLTSRADFRAAGRRKLADEVDGHVRGRIGRLRTGLAGRVAAQVAELPGQRIAMPEVDDRGPVHDSAAMASALDARYWRPFGWFFGREAQDAGTHRKRVEREWATSREDAWSTAAGRLDRTIVHLRGELERCTESLDAELELVSSSPEADHGLADARDAAERWCGRFEDLLADYRKGTGDGAGGADE